MIGTHAEAEWPLLRVEVSDTLAPGSLWLLTLTTQGTVYVLALIALANLSSSILPSTSANLAMQVANVLRAPDPGKYM